MNKIQIHPDICNEKPTIAGTRITVQTIMEFLGTGDSISDILEEYPNLTEDDIYDCLQHFEHHPQPLFFVRLPCRTQVNKILLQPKFDFFGVNDRVGMF
jgi:uncharacterized protein (DUF433 family)